MKKLLSSVFLTSLLLTACVTINIYFPAAATEKAADEIIKGIQGEALMPEPEARLPYWQLSLYRGIDSVLNLVIAPAHAAANLSINSPEISRLRATMQSRFSQLRPFYQQGFVGIKADGLLTARNHAKVPLSQRNGLNKLVGAENSDREKLYRAIAQANGHPEWSAQIKQTFASRWVSNAQSGWWYQSSNGSWKQK